MSDETQASMDALADVKLFFTKFNTSAILQTKFHDQKDTDLCHSYSVMSGLRHIIRQILLNKNLNSVVDLMEEGRECSFYRFLAVFIGCVNPRSFDELFKARVMI